MIRSRDVTRYCSAGCVYCSKKHSRLCPHSACVFQNLGVARLALIARARRLNWRALRVELMDAHVSPTTSRLILDLQVGCDANGTGGPWHVGGGAGPTLAHAARLILRALGASVQHLLAVRRRVCTTLPKGWLRRILEMAEPALCAFGRFERSSMRQQRSARGVYHPLS